MKAKEADTELKPPVNQLYAQVNKKKKLKETEAKQEPPVEQLYAQVDKKGKKNKSKEKGVCAEELGAVYSVVNKLSPPQIPPKSQ